MSTNLTKLNDFTSPEVLAAREQVIDEQIEPLLAQIRDICLANNIACVSYFNWGTHPECKTDSSATAVFPQHEDGTPIKGARENLSGFTHMRFALYQLVGE